MFAIHAAVSPCDRPKSMPPPIYTSKYIDREEDSDFEEGASDASDSDIEDPGWCKSDERRIAKNREISEYGRVWNCGDTHAVNEQLYGCLSSMDPAPTAGLPCSMWSTIIASPISDKINRAFVNKQFHLGKVRQLEAVLSKNVYAVQKNNAQLVCAFRLERCPHSVLGPRGAKAFANSFGASIKPLTNMEDHMFDPQLPDKPIVCNTDHMVGLSNLV
jgi:hypothetical protein